MGIFLVRRLLGATLTLGVLLAAVFFLLRLAPGGPFDGEKVWPAEIQENINRKYGLDQPLEVQFGRWISGVIQGDLGDSFHYLDMPVSELLGKAIGPSLLLGGVALALAILIGIPLGVVSAWKRGTVWDTSAMLIAISGVSLPSYLVATVLVLVFSLWLKWLPPALWDESSAWILPAITLALRPLSMIARLTRASMLETLHSDYVRTAFSKGLAETNVVFKHALRNALIPVLTLLGPLLANLITGSFVVEVVFQIPGMGKYFVSAVLNRDYPLVMGVTLLYGWLLILSNLAVDLAYGWVDPRVRADS